MFLLSECAIDLVFVLCSSFKITQATWTNMIQFVWSIVSRMNIGPDAVQIGLVTYGFFGKSQFYLQNSTHRLTMLNRISNLPSIAQLADWSNLAAGLSEVYNNQFTIARGDRVNVPNVVVVLTPQPADQGLDSTYIQANFLKAAGMIQIYSIGINSASTNEIRNISSSPQTLNYNYFLPGDDSQLYTIVDTLYNILCPAAFCPG